MNTDKNIISVPGDAGQLEAWVDVSDDQRATAPICVICHPHPLYGGSMMNKVVFTIAKAMSQSGIDTIRFNFRGVGQSEGSFGGGLGESSDLRRICEWVRSSYPGRPLWLAGFSFGAFVVLNCFNDLCPKVMISVAPPVGSTYFDFSPEFSVDVPWLVINGDKDELIDPRDIGDWVLHLSPQPGHTVITGADHFFNGSLSPLKTAILEFCGECWPGKV